jgi:hypothetical protein
MSRTYRRTKRTPSWMDDEWLCPQWKYNSDKYNFSNDTEYLKWETSHKRRAEERKQLHTAITIADIEDLDFVNYEKKYLGFIRYWD